MPRAHGRPYQVTDRSSRISRSPRICSATDKCGPSERDINLLWDVYVYERPLAANHPGQQRRARRMDGEQQRAVARRNRTRAGLHVNTSELARVTKAHDEDLFIFELESRDERRATYRKFSISIRSEVVVLRWTRTVFPSGDTARRFGSKGALTLPRTRTRPVEGSST